MSSKVWITKEGKQIPINKMSDTHLINSINFIKRKASSDTMLRHTGQKDREAFVIDWMMGHYLYGELIMEAARRDLLDHSTQDILAKIGYKGLLDNIYIFRIVKGFVGILAKKYPDFGTLRGRLSADEYTLYSDSANVNSMFCADCNKFIKYGSSCRHLEIDSEGNYRLKDTWDDVPF